MKKNVSKKKNMNMKKDFITIIASLFAVAVVVLGVRFILKDDKVNPNNEKTKKLVNCEYEGNLELGATFEFNNYLYTYIEMENDGKKINGWNVKYTDINNTEPTKVPNCGTIGNKPIISTENMFEYSATKLIDVSEFNTSNVINMRGMFASTLAKEIVGLDGLDTSKATDMSGMFYHSYVEKLDLHAFDTSKVLDMNSMFEGAQTTEYNLTSFNTINVYDMSRMFKDTVAEVLDVSTFDISNVLYMDNTFENSLVEIIDVGSRKAEWDNKILESVN